MYQKLIINKTAFTEMYKLGDFSEWEYAGDEFRIFYDNTIKTISLDSESKPFDDNDVKVVAMELELYEKMYQPTFDYLFNNYKEIFIESDSLKALDNNNKETLIIHHEKLSIDAYIHINGVRL